MHPVLFKIGGLAVYSYGFMIAIGIIVGVAYMSVQGKKEVGLSFDQANTLFVFIFIAAFVGGKVFLFFEGPSYYLHSPGDLVTGRGFVFYGSFLFAIPTMLWYFRKNKLNAYQMLDVMAVTTCLVHMFGRVGCFFAGCCYGSPTKSVFGVTYTDPSCLADPKNLALHPTQLYEAFYILLVMILLLFMRRRRTFYGQLFLIYLVLYAIGRSVLELFRGDEARGYIIHRYLSYAQFTALLITLVVIFLYYKWRIRNAIAQIENK